MGFVFEIIYLIYLNKNIIIWGFERFPLFWRVQIWWSSTFWLQSPLIYLILLLRRPPRPSIPFWVFPWGSLCLRPSLKWDWWRSILRGQFVRCFFKQAMDVVSFRWDWTSRIIPSWFWSRRVRLYAWVSSKWSSLVSWRPLQVFGWCYNRKWTIYYVPLWFLGPFVLLLLALLLTDVVVDLLFVLLHLELLGVLSWVGHSCVRGSPRSSSAADLLRIVLLPTSYLIVLRPIRIGVVWQALCSCRICGRICRGGPRRK